MAEIRGCVPGGAAAVDPVAVSTLADDSNQSDGYSYAPTLSISAGAAGGTWSTVGVRTSDDSAVSVTGSTTTTPSATLTAADLTAGEAFRMTSTYTVGSLSDSVTSVVRVAGVAGTSDFDRAFTEVDLTDGSWTLLDPSTLVKSLAFVAGKNVVTWNTLAVGSQDFSPISTGSLLAPRWYKALEIDGNAVTSADLIQFVSRIENDEAVDDFAQSNIIGVCEAPTSTTLTTLRGAGGSFNCLAASAGAYGPWNVNGAAASGTASAAYGVCATLYGAGHSGAGAGVTFTAAGARDNASVRAGATALSASAPLYVVVCFGTRGVVTIAEDDQSSNAFGYVASSILNP